MMLNANTETFSDEVMKNHEGLRCKVSDHGRIYLTARNEMIGERCQLGYRER